MDKASDQANSPEAYESVSPDLGSTSLSDREKEVLLLAGEGLTDKEIALRLQIGPKTVRTYWDRMRAKMGAASRTEVLAKALQTAYDELAASEQRVRLFVEQMPVLFMALDPQWNVLAANDEVFRTTGFNADQTVGKPIFNEENLPDEDERNRALRSLVERSGDFRDVELEVQCDDGSRRSIAWSSRAKEQPIPGWASWVIGVDITDRKRAQEALKTSEESLRRLLEASEQGVWIVDTQHTTTFVNDRLASMLGTTVESMLGQPAFLREGEQGELLREILTSSTKGGGRIAFTDKFRRPDGAELWARVAVNPLYSDDGTLNGHAAVLTDVTPRKRAEDQRDNARQAYNTLLNHVSDRILRFNRDLTCVFANFEIDVNEAGGHPVVEGRSWDDLDEILSPAEEWRGALLEVLRQGQRTVLSEATIGAVSSQTYAVVLLPERNEEGRVVHALAIASPLPSVAVQPKAPAAALI